MGFKSKALAGVGAHLQLMVKDCAIVIYYQCAKYALHAVSSLTEYKRDCG